MREIKRVIFFKQVYEIDAPSLSASSVSENLRRMRLPEGKILKLTIVITFESLTWKESFKTILSLPVNISTSSKTSSMLSSSGLYKG